MAVRSNSVPRAVARGVRLLPTRLRSLLPTRSRERFVAIGVALILAIAVGDWLTISMEREASFASREATNTLLARGMIAQTSLKLAAIDKELRDLPAELAIAGAASPELIKARLRAPAATDLLRDLQKRLTGVGVLGLVDADGRVANATREGSPLAGDLSGSDFFVRLSVHADAEPFVGAPERDGVSGAWTSFIARRITDAHGAFAGVALAQLSLGDLEDFYRIAVPPRRVVTILRNDGTVLVQYPRGVDFTGQRVDGLAAHTPGASNCATYHGPDMIDGASVVGAVCRLKNMPLVLQAAATEADALEGWKQERLWLVLGGVLASAVTLALLRLFAAQVHRLEVSERSLAAEKLQAQTAHRQLDLALSNIPQGVCFFDADRRLVVSNERYCEVYGLPAGSIQPGATLEQIVDLRFAAVGVSKRNRAEYADWLEAIARSGEAHHSIVELDDGRTIAMQSQPIEGGGWVATHEDITERRQAEEKIAFLARHDALTGLANRSLLMERIAQAFLETARGGRFAVLFLDLDRFKAVNDTLGHNVGDELLRNVATRLTATVRHGCTVARLGGDEFVVLEVGLKTPEDAARLARRIIKQVAAPYRIGDHEVVIGVSVGVDISSEEACTAEILLKHADLALYLSKAQGRGTFRFFEPEMDSHQRNRHDLEVDLRRAVAERQFELHYQPILEATSGTVCAFEALLRWRHPSRGLVSPGEFIPLAEESGLIIPIGEWVIQEACRQAARWPEPIRVAVNLSPAQFRAVSLVPVIQEALSAAGLAPDRLELEITESVLLQSNERNLGVLHQLRNLGIAIAMDDFGVGYSSMSYLRKFPFDKIKIDRSFVMDLANRNDCVYFVRAIVDLCRNLGIKTTAEGVESFDQLSVLLEEGCTEMQGYLFARPGPAEAVEELIGSGRLIPSRESLDALSTSTASPRVAGAH